MPSLSPLSSLGIYALVVEEEQIKIVTGLGQKFIQPRFQPVSKKDVCFFFQNGIGCQTTKS